MNDIEKALVLCGERDRTVVDVIAIARSADKESAYRERVKRG